ncbi:TetR/AcrR family transcriptional regulator [Sphaerisporangium sp. NPDC049002]|uniref:TetR/AcrR family transcriptional regulator n=1 Tax=Sphaerisporangium sp. NPDC049002 TaxID=3155392 RepID=UPI0033FADDBA
MQAWRVEDEPPPTSTRGRPLSPKGERTRRRLLDASEEVFAELGYHEASIVKITEAAGCSQGTFYIYFEGKQQIFDELVADLNRRVRRAMSEGARQGRTRPESERLGFKGFFRFTAEHPGLYRIIRQAEFVSPGMLQRHYRTIADGYVGGLRAAMADGEIAQADPEVLAWALMGVGELIGMRWILWKDGPGGVPDQVFEEMYAFILRGLGADGAPSGQGTHVPEASGSGPNGSGAFGGGSER